MSANSDSSSSHTHASEESPLTASARRSSSEKELRSSLSGMIVEGIKRTFENFEFDVLSNRVSERGNDGSEKGDAVYDEIRGQNGRRRSGCCRVLIVIRIVFLCMLLMLMGASYGFGRWGWGIPFTNYNWDTSCCSYADPVMALKGSCALEDLENAAVATDHELCSEVGNSILLDGGNAVDAAVAAALCLGVANPSSSGLGGGAFILIHSDQANHESRSRSVKHPDFHDARDVTMTAGGAHMAKMTEAIDCREIAPGAATQDMYSSKPVDASSFGGFSVAVPGELKGLELAHARHGKLPWEKVVEPAMKMARDGFPIFSHLASDIKRTAEVTTKKHGEFPPLRKLLTKHDSWDSYLKEGDILKNPKLAETLQLITKVGSDGLYKGDLAKRLVDEVVEGGGILSVDDMANYLPTIRSPVVGNSNGFTLVGVPPPSSGGAVLIGAARFLSGYKSPLASARDTLAVHRTVEALRHAFAIRMSLSDPAYYTNATKTAVQDLISGDYMESLRRVTLDNSTLSLSMYGGEKWSKLHDSDGQSDADDAHEGDRRLRRSKNKVNLTRRLARRFGYLEDSGTSHLSIVDKEGNAVAMTTSVNNIFGSHVFSESTGVLLGNTMDDFGTPGRSNHYGLKPSKENFIAPGKKPLSSMSPTFVFQNVDGSPNDDFGKLVLVLGASGGPKIITAVLQVFLNYCMLGMPIFESVVRPRIHEQLLYHDSAVTTTERALLDQGPLIEVPQRTKDALLRRGHDSLLEIDYTGCVQAVAVDPETNKLAAMSDIRKGGKPAGH